MHPAERLEITDVHSLAAIVARDPAFPERRRRLLRVVAGAVGTCTMILVAAGIVRLGRSTPDAAAAAPITIASAVVPAAALPASPAERAPAVAPPPDPPAPATTTGTLNLQRPALPGHVWVDGKKVSQAAQTVSCGKHKVKVGAWGHTHTVDVPCGGELTIAK